MNEKLVVHVDLLIFSGRARTAQIFHQETEVDGVEGGIVGRSSPLGCQLDWNAGRRHCGVAPVETMHEVGVVDETVLTNQPTSVNSSRKNRMYAVPRRN